MLLPLLWQVSVCEGEDSSLYKYNSLSLAEPAEEKPSPCLINAPVSFNSDLWKQAQKIICQDSDGKGQLAGARSKLAPTRARVSGRWGIRESLCRAGGKEMNFFCACRMNRGAGEKRKSCRASQQLANGVLDWTQSLILPLALGRCHFKCSWTKTIMAAEGRTAFVRLNMCMRVGEKVLTRSCGGNPAPSDCTDSGCSPLLGGQTGYSSSAPVPSELRANKKTLALLLLIFSMEFCR